MPADTRVGYVLETEEDYHSFDPLSQRKRILDLVEKKGNISRRDVELLLQVGQTRAYLLLKDLEKEGLLVQEKRGRSSFYHKV